MKRKIYSKLLDWKNNPHKKPLVLYGARQVGKTYILKEFGSKEYENMVYVNCDKNEPVRNLFSQDNNTNRILEGIEVLYSQKITPGKTLIFFDEVQDIPSIVASLKYFYENMPQYDVVCAGSLLGVHDLKGYSFPVGKIDILCLYPMTFVEFLEGSGEDGLANLLSSGFDLNLVNHLLPVLSEHLRKYYFVGGMPEAVKIFHEENNYDRVREIQKTILNGYYADIAKHTGINAIKCHQVLSSLPSQLAKENKKFIYGAIKKGARAKDFETAIQWLSDAGIIYKILRINKVKLPIKFYTDPDAFKLFLLDVGLLGAMAEVPPQEIIISNNIFSEYKGAFTENYVLTQLIPVENVVITYFSKENSTMEIDFVVQKDSKIYPIEIKAEENVKSKSLHQFITIDNKDNNLKGIRLSMKGFINQGWMLNVPLAYAGNILTL